MELGELRERGEDFLICFPGQSARYFHKNANIPEDVKHSMWMQIPYVMEFCVLKKNVSCLVDTVPLDPSNSSGLAVSHQLSPKSALSMHNNMNLHADSQ